MENEKDHPGIYVPPPLFYVAMFLLSVFMQKKIPINHAFFQLTASKWIGAILLFLASFFLVRSLGRFLQSRNTLVTIRPANSLQVGGIYSRTRNPMYLGLVIVYAGLSFLIGGWWNLILLPVLIIIVQEYIIRREEEYLQRRFGDEYLAYKSSVRRWL